MCICMWRGGGVRGGAGSSQGGLELARGDPLPACFAGKVGQRKTIRGNEVLISGKGIPRRGQFSLQTRRILILCGYSPALLSLQAKV